MDKYSHGNHYGYASISAPYRYNPKMYIILLYTLVYVKR